MPKPARRIVPVLAAYLLPAILLTGAASAQVTAPVAAPDPAVEVTGITEADRAAALAAIDRGLAFLRSSQNDDGSWTPDPGPAVTALALAAFLDRPGIDPDDPAPAAALNYILDQVNDDGSIHSGILANYNTAISVSALARLANRPGVPEIIRAAQDFLRDLQWAGQLDPHGDRVDSEHPYFGGAGYGKHGRPDLSNTQIMLQALHDSGLPADDPAYQRALVFITRTQATATNDLFTADQIGRDGGFIYATSINQDAIGVPQSMASPEQIDEGRAGRPVSGLRTYGSMTYAGFKSYLYADLDPDDPRVLDALGWIRAHYTLDRNPGMPGAIERQGLYYYYLTFARALDAWGQPTIDTEAAGPRPWRADLVRKLVAQQRPDGSWVNAADRWMEDDPNLVTAYTLLALHHALGQAHRP